MDNPIDNTKSMATPEEQIERANAVLLKICDIQARNYRMIHDFAEKMTGALLTKEIARTAIIQMIGGNKENANGR